MVAHPPDVFSVTIMVTAPKSHLRCHYFSFGHCDLPQNLFQQRRSCHKEIKMGVTKEVIREGDGTNFPTKGVKLSMHYKGTLASNGEAFDSSYDRGRPFEFKIGKGEVIQGWDEGGTVILCNGVCLCGANIMEIVGPHVVLDPSSSIVMKMSLGEKAKLLISSDYGYGAQGIGPIPPNADLVFEVELLKIGEMEANLPAEGGCCVIQ